MQFSKYKILLNVKQQQHQHNLANSEKKTNEKENKRTN